MKSGPIPGHKNSLGILQFFDEWLHQSLVTSFFNSVVTLT